ncbi:hypothetical protein GCM10011352_09700 [Marinobacterium zhoushanense]|uniref:Anti-sigma-K factor RskA n=1 Tax=Marinobacterium zhoushanense TaxID=1679163 RepID=A0ABQ1K6G6_9GAMM|nr:hypothetical protein [Marinobacterium zhoushanense]GGB85876.1 hypothetical protein GCM10011352_09700 [Marinobacterium zhoushanense]
MPGIARYRDPGLCDALAADYVTGRMSHLCRARMEELCRTELLLSAAVERWSQHLLPLQEQLPPRPPPPQVWQSIDVLINTDRTPSPSPLWQRLWPWRLATLVSSLLLLALAYNTWMPSESHPSPAYLAPLSANGEIRLVISAYQDEKPGHSRLYAQWTESFLPHAPAQSYLWTDGSEREPPVLLGELGAAETEWRVSPERWQALKRSRYLLVSLDADTPARPVLQGPCLELHYDEI